MGLAADLAEAARGEVAEIVREGDPNAEGQSGSAGRPGMALGFGEQTVGDAVAAEIRVHGKATQIKVVAVTGREHAADEAIVRLCDDYHVIRKRRGNRLGCLAEGPRLRLELAAVFFERGTDELGNPRGLRGCREADRDLARRGAQMPVCSGRWSSATKLLNLVVSPSKRSITLLMGPWRCFATMISALP